MVEGSSLEEYEKIEENLVADIRHLCRLKRTKKETNGPKFKRIRNILD